MSQVNILVFDSSGEKDQFLDNIFVELAERGFSFWYYSSFDAPALENKGGFFKKAFFGSRQSGFASGLFFPLALPWLRTFYFFRLAFIKIKRKPKTAVLVGWNEKIIISPITRLLRIKTVWIERPGADYDKKSFWARHFYKAYSGKTQKIAFNGLTKERLVKLGLSEENIMIIGPGIRIRSIGEQKALPLDAPEALGLKFKNKFFTVGTVADLNSGRTLETLFQAIKICSEFIPNIQLIVVGDGAEKRNLGWMVKKMGIDSLVWLVGEHGHTRKWLDSFDLFFVSSSTITMPDMNTVLKCMSAGLPIIAPAGLGLEDIVLEDKTGIFINTKDNQAVAGEIIKLFREQAKRHKLGLAGKARAKEFFDLNNKVEEFEKIIR